jgi:rhomboid protease GluP
MLLTVIIILGILTTFFPAWLTWGANDLRAIRERGEVYRLFTSIFLHTGLWHLLLNANLLYILGFSLEQRVGHKRFLLIFLLGGLFGAVAHLLTTDIAGLGASGGLYALLGANAVLLHQRRTVLSRGERFYLYFLVALGGAGLILGLLLESGLFSLPIHAGNGAHIGGLVTGMAMAWPDTRPAGQS